MSNKIKQATFEYSADGLITIYVELDNWTKFKLFSFMPEETLFSEYEFKGLTVEEAFDLRKLKQKRFDDIYNGPFSVFDFGKAMTHIAKPISTDTNHEETKKE